MNQSNRTDWHKEIYGGERDGGRMSKMLYRRLLAELCKVFKYTCQACRTRYTRRSGVLALHHILPREQGGTNDSENLILLCEPCHDKIEPEWEKYRTYQSILYAFADRPERVTKTKKETVGRKWQQWVYGGQKNPLNEN